MLVKFFRLLCLSSLFSISCFVQAQTFGTETILITEPYANASRPGQSSGAAWLTLQNKSENADSLLSVSSNVANVVQVHDMKMEDKVMKMFQVDSVDIPAHGSITFGNGNKLHIMMMELKKPLVAGEQFPITLVFKKAGAITVDVVVRESKHGSHQASDKKHKNNKDNHEHH